jgi:hypothetical protein
MKLLIAAFVLAVLAVAGAELGVEFFDGRIGQHDPALRAIHYDSNYELTARRRHTPE